MVLSVSSLPIHNQTRPFSKESGLYKIHRGREIRQQKREWQPYLPGGYVPSSEILATYRGRQRALMPKTIVPKLPQRQDRYQGTNAVFIDGCSIEWTSEYRDTNLIGTNACGRLRKQRNRVPAVLFRPNSPNKGVINLSLDKHMLMRAWEQWRDSLLTKVIKLNIEGYDKPFQVIIKQINIHPVTQEALNVSFMSFHEGHPNKVKMPVNLINTDSPTSNLILQKMWSIPCIWQGDSHIPNLLLVDCKDIENGQILRHRDLKYPNGLFLEKPHEDSIVAICQGASRGKDQYIIEDEEAKLIAEAERLKALAQDAAALVQKKKKRR